MRRINVAVMSIMAQDDNLGDIEIRQRLFSCVAATGAEMLVYRGTASDSYIDAFDDADRTQWFESSVRLQTQVLSRLLRGHRIHFLMAPGPSRFTSSPRAILKSLANLANMVLARLSGGTVHIVGRAYRGNGLTRAIEVLALRLANTATVRDRLSSELVSGRASAMPDLAFMGCPQLGGARDRIAISVREEPDLDESAFEAPVAAARDLGLKPVFVTQVKRDNPWMSRMARAHGAELLEWDGATHRAQRDAVEKLYRSSALVLSNRLHGLIMGAMAGAYPVPIVSGGNTKLVPTLAPTFGDVPSIAAKDVSSITPAKLSALVSHWQGAELGRMLHTSAATLEQHLAHVAASISKE